MKIACCQFSPKLQETETNLEQIRSMANAADADILVFPELALTGYFFRTIDQIVELGQQINGPLANAIAVIARAEQKAIVTGFLESANGKYYNSSLAFDSTGKLSGHYRKVHRFYFETQIFERGNLGFPVFDLVTRSGVAKMGMMVCYDWRFPEAARSLALNGAELIAVPSNIVTTTGMLHTVFQTRAFENKVNIAFADRIGTEINGEETLYFRGESAVFSYSGKILARASENETETISAEIDLTATRTKRINNFNDLFEDRAPESYK